MRDWAILILGVIKLHEGNVNGVTLLEDQIVCQMIRKFYCFSGARRTIFKFRETYRT
jgi:hypothetical protein